MGLLDNLTMPYAAERIAEKERYNRLAQIFTDRQGSVMSQPMGEPWRPDHERIGGHALQAPMISPDDLIGTGIPTKLAGLLMSGVKSGGVGLLGAGMIKSQYGRIPETGKEIKSLAEMLDRAGTRAGHEVSISRSGVSPSTYLTFSKDGMPSQQVRISNHKDVYPELAPTGEGSARFSVDPNTENTFEQAVNWLADKGFATDLSKRFNPLRNITGTQGISNSSPEVALQKKISAWMNLPKATRGPRPTE